MELMQLEMFVAVVEEASVQKAAERVFRTQPAVSLALGKLERGLGAPLLERRRGRHRRLTPAGELLYAYAMRIVALRDEALSRLKGEASQCGGRVRVGVSGPANMLWFSRIAAAFSHRNPRVRLEVFCDCPGNLLRELRQWSMDLVLLTAQPECTGAGDLVVIPVSGSSGGYPFWMLRRRVGYSHLVMRLEDFLISGSVKGWGRFPKDGHAIGDRAEGRPGVGISQGKTSAVRGFSVQPPELARP